MGDKIKMKEEQPESKKLSYEDLEKYAVQASQQLQFLQKEMEKYNNTNFHQRMAYLFKVIELSTVFGDSFVNKCIEEIKGVLTIPEQPDKEETK